MPEINSIARAQIDKIAAACNRIKPKVVITSLAYNHELYVKDALEGFVMQKTNFPIVAIVHEDCSTDNTARIIKEYEKKYPDIIFPIFEEENQYSKQNGTLSRIMRTAIAASGAKYVAMCEGDDYWTDPLKLQKQVDFLESHPEYGMCYAKAKFYYQESKKYGKYLFGNEYNSLTDLLCNTYAIPTASIVYKRDFIDYNYYKIIEKHPEWKMGDLPLSLYLASKSKLQMIDEPMVVYRILKESTSHFKSYDQYASFINSAYSVKKEFAKLNNVWNTCKKCHHLNLRNELLRAAVVSNDFKALNKALKNNKGFDFKYYIYKLSSINIYIFKILRKIIIEQ